METENDNVQENRYDAEGLRFELLENGRRTSFVYHNGELLHEEGREENQTSYHLGLGIDAFQRGQELSYYHLDEQLSTAIITSQRGAIKNSYQYDAFGAEVEATEQLSNRIRYTGQQYDELPEQYYLRARYYNPILGRFMQEDTYWGDGLNLYAYCGNNPVMYYDPSGYDGTSCSKGASDSDGVDDESSSYTYNNGTYEGADYHSGQTTGRKNPAPQDGQFALDNSVPIGDNTTRRVGIDIDESFVVFDETSPGIFHGHIRDWNRNESLQGLSQDMKNALYRAGYVKSSKGTKFKLTNSVINMILDFLNK